MAQTFETTIGNLTSGITGSVGDVDTRVGSVLRDGFLAPAAFEFTNVYGNQDIVSANQGINTAAQQSDASLENLGSNYGVSRFVGTRASGVERFLRYTKPTYNIEIPAGTKVYTELSSSRVSFSTLATVYLTPTSPQETGGAYYVDSAIQCDDIGEIGNAIAGGISYVELTGVDACYNPLETTSGTDVQTNEEFVNTISSTARGNIGTKTGYESAVRSNFAVADVKVIAGRDSDAIRSQYGGSIDVVILDEVKTAIVESVTFVNTATTTQFVPTFRPLVEMTSISGTNTSGAVVLTEGPLGDYEVLYDTYSIYRGSIYENSKVVLHYNATNHGGDALVDGSALTVEYLYTYNVPAIQSYFNEDENNVLGSDVIAKSAKKILANVTATAKVFPGYSLTSVQTAIAAALTTYFNALLLDADIQSSDVISIITGVSGVDSVNVATFSLARASNPGVSLQEILVNRSEYIRGSTFTITVTG